MSTRVLTCIRASNQQCGRRFFASGSEKTESLKDVLFSTIPEKQAKLKTMKASLGKKVISSYTLHQCLSGGEGIEALYGHNISSYGASHRLEYHGQSLPSLSSKGFLSEDLLWLLMSEKRPLPFQSAGMQADMEARSQKPISTEVDNFIKSLPKDMNIMTQLSMAVLHCQPESLFYKTYSGGALRKPQFWQSTFEDSLNIIARLPSIAGRVYSHKYHSQQYSSLKNINEVEIVRNDNGKKRSDYVGRLTASLFPQYLQTDHTMVDFQQFIQFFTLINADDDNISHPFSHAVHLTNCTLSDAYKAISTGINSLAGPRVDSHDETFAMLQWLNMLQSAQNSGENNIIRTINTFVSNNLSPRTSVMPTTQLQLQLQQQIPGFIVSTTVDPRVALLIQFIELNIPTNELYTLSLQVKETIDRHLHSKSDYHNNDLSTGGNAQLSAFPTVSLLTNIIIHHYLHTLTPNVVESAAVGQDGVTIPLTTTEVSTQQVFDVYLLLYTISRSFGALSHIVWDRALGLSLENIKSVDIPFVEEYFKLKDNRGVAAAGGDVVGDRGAK